MDSWLVAAAATAGCFAEYWRNHRMDRTSYPELRTRKAETGCGPFCGSAPGSKLRGDVYSKGRDVTAAAVDSASGFDSDMVGSLGHCIDSDLISQSSLASGFSDDPNLRKDQCSKGPRIYIFSDPHRKCSLLETRYSYGHLLKPLSSLDGSIMAELYMKHVEMEEYVCTSLPSPPTAISRPLIVTDGTQIISRANDGLPSGPSGTMDSNLHNQATSEKNGHVYGIPPLRKIKSLDNEKQFDSQHGPDEGAVLLRLGISIGIMSSYIGNQREVSKLRGLLNHTENVVQDLRDELEMKDSLTVNEIANEKNESQETYDNLIHDRGWSSSSIEQHLDSLKLCYGRESYNDKVEESSESMSRIEAELEAELERMGLNMNVSNLERRLSDLVELDPDFVADFADGELRSDMVNVQALVESVSDEDRGGNSTTHSGNYAVSPRELRLRLHEVIQSRLEERVEELETALRNSQRKLKLMESEENNSWNVSNNEWKYNEEFDFPSNPLVMKLTGEALDAYNEACKELLKTDESEEDDDAGSDIYHSHQDELPKYDRKSFTEEAVYGRGKTSEDQTSRVRESLDVGVDEDECSDCDDEMEKQLIEKIVEKSKKGSHALLNAQRIWFSPDQS
ncbi:hypothetical protein like AT5G61040 [Hibiscus trionum]|uniref:Uncharacterized protein n=1 Tax=Hibiscus trionum TaxID=183268 RepID=A0A9W7J356_HIBTR|nr:hypothetical protein like AT5G61040 [Hibiscus trionum]